MSALPGTDRGALPPRRPAWLPASLLAMLLASLLTIPLAPALGTALELPLESAVPGGIKILHLGSVAELGTSAPSVESAGSRVLVLEQGGEWIAVVGIPLSAPVGPRRVLLETAGASGSAGANAPSTMPPAPLREPRPIEFLVGEKTYASQSLKVAPAQVNLSPKDLARSKREAARIGAALDHWSSEAPETLRFPAPIAGVRSSSFGMRRIFNGEARNPHTGMDIAAAEGTPILAPLAGRVLDTGNFFFTGNTVLIDHGRGFVSMYCHLSQVAVHRGERLAAGTRIGAVGKTGRATGPHLHWALSLNHAWVDPALFVQ